MSATFGKYRLIAELGRGGMADVFLAVAAGPSGFSKLTVIKRLRQDIAEDPEFVAMLVDEARIAARLNHPNVVQTNEVGDVDNRYFIAMEYLDGQPLQRIQARSAAYQKEGRSGVDKNIEYLIVADALAGLHHAHELTDYDGSPLQIVHRDVSPQNIFVTYEGQVKVVDFGIAKAVGRVAETQQGMMKGKVRYMPPEQALGERVDRRADLFSAGIVLWEIAVGRRLWSNMDDVRIVQALLGDKIPRSPIEVEPKTPPEIDAICRKALAQRPEDRYETALEMRRDLERYLTDIGAIVEARRELGPSIARLFADKREEMRKLIEEQLAELKTRPSLERVPVPDSSSALGPSSSRPLTTTGPVTVPLADPEAETKAEASSSISAEVRSFAAKRSASWKIRVGAAVAIVACTAAVWAWSRRETSDPDIVDPKTPLIAVSLQASPETARILLDGRDLGGRFSAKLPRDNNMHTIVVRAEGFVEESESVSFTDDLSRSYTLVPVSPLPTNVAATATSGATRPKPAPPSRVVVSPPVKTSAPAPSPVASATATPAPTPTPTPPPPRTEIGGKRRREIDTTDPFVDHGNTKGGQQ